MLYLHGLGHFYPENVINNAFLESLDIGTSDRWILERNDRNVAVLFTDSVRMLQTLFSVNGNRFQFVGHQANLGMLQTVCTRAGIAEANHWHNVEDYGNTGCAGAPSVVSQHWDDLHPENYVAIALVGSGLTWTHMMIEVKEEA